MHVRTFTAAVGCCLLAAATWAQADSKGEIVFTEGVGGGSITDGVNSWVITGANPNDGVLTNYEVPTGSDHQFSTWWWYRVAGDSAETQMPPPDTESYVGNEAILTWTDVNNRGLFDAELTVFIFDVGGALLSQRLVVTDISGSNLDLQVFAYTDMDMDASSGGDSAIESAPGHIEITDTSTATYFGQGPDGYRVDAFPVVRDALNDAAIDDFNNTGLPFGPGDYTGGFQWGRVLAAGEAYAFGTANCLNTSPAICAVFPFIFFDGFETGDISNWDSAVP